MKSVRVELGERSYDIRIAPGLIDRCGQEIARVCRPSVAAILTHPSLDRLYGERVARSLEEAGIRAAKLVVPAGERHKTLRTAERLHRRLVEAGIDRSGLLVILGGGVLGDLGGFVAATYLRGIPVVQVPTTLLAQVDASIGGKTGVDLPEGKNLVGAFHQPLSVIVDPNVLRSLPLAEVRSGLAEVIKYGIIGRSSLFDTCAACMDMLLRRDPQVLQNVIHESCDIKASVVSGDERETGRRAILNFGHTVGHAIEALTAYRRYKHGEAVAIGMVTAGLIGVRLGVTKRRDLEALANVLRSAGLPVAFPADLSGQDAALAMQRDKKAVSGDPRFVLMREIGVVEAGVKAPLSDVLAAICEQKAFSTEAR